MSDVSKELSLDDINEMLRKTQEEIRVKENSIKSMEKSLANAKNRLAVLRGREGMLKLDVMKKKFGVQSVDELMQRLDAALGESTSSESSKATKGTKDLKNGKLEGKKEEGSADFSKMW